MQSRQLTLIAWDTPVPARGRELDHLLAPYCIHQQGSVRWCYLSLEERRLLRCALRAQLSDSDRSLLCVVAGVPPELRVPGTPSIPQPRQAFLL